MLPCVKDLAADGSQYVRTALAGVVMEMAPALGKAATIEHLLPVFLSLLKDDFPDVRLNIIAKLDQARRSWRFQSFSRAWTFLVGWTRQAMHAVREHGHPKSSLEYTVK